MPIWTTVVMTTYHHQERSSTPSTRSSPSWASVHGAFVHKEAQRKVYKLSEIINGLNWEKVARLQVKLHIKKQHGHASWSMMRQTFSCLLSKYEVQNTIQCRYERQLSWLLTIIRSDLQHHLRDRLHPGHLCMGRSYTKKHNAKCTSCQKLSMD